MTVLEMDSIWVERVKIIINFNIKILSLSLTLCQLINVHQTETRRQVWLISVLKILTKLNKIYWSRETRRLAPVCILLVCCLSVCLSAACLLSTVYTVSLLSLLYEIRQMSMSANHEMLYIIDEYICLDICFMIHLDICISNYTLLSTAPC